MVFLDFVSKVQTQLGDLGQGGSGATSCAKEGKLMINAIMSNKCLLIGISAILFRTKLQNELYNILCFSGGCRNKKQFK
jgi:hypothetical protein